MIVVLDSGIWISALQFGGTPALAVEKALTSDQVAICDEIENEVSRVLSEKMQWAESRVNESLEFYFQEAIRVPVHGMLQGVCRDPKDHMVIECAVNASADLIVTGDRDLLDMKSYQEIFIVTARHYVSNV